MAPSLDPHSPDLRISTARLLTGLIWVAIGLLAVHIALQYRHYLFEEVPWLGRQLFDVDEENNLPTWFSGAILLLNSCLLLVVAGRRRREGNPWARHWLGLGLGFLLLSIDEIAGMHETLNTLLGREISWALPLGIVACAVGAFYLPFLWSLPLRTSALFGLAGGIYLGGAVGVELATEWYAEWHLLNTLDYNLWTALEEGMEMGGVLLFIRALVRYVEPDCWPSIAVSLRPGAAPSTAPAPLP